MGHSQLSKGIGQLALGGRVEPSDHVVPSLNYDWLSGRGLATEEGAFPRGLREGRGGAKRGWAQCVMAAPWPRVHLYRSLGPVTKESRRHCRSLPRVGPEAGEVSAAAQPRCFGKPLGTRSGGGSEGWGRP